MIDEQRSRSVTRADVARYAGVSTAVVSYVLNNGPKPVAALTKERVLDAVRVLGYRPNAAARALSKGSADMFGLVIHDNRSPFFAELCHAFDLTRGASGRSLLVVNSDRSQVDTAEQLRDLASRQISGLIMAVPLTVGEQALVESLRLPTVMIGPFGDTEALPAVSADLAAGTRAAVNHLIDHGYQEIAFVGSAARYDARDRGWADALVAAGLQRGPLIHTEFTYEGGYTAGVQLAEMASLPRAVFAASDQVGIGMLAALSERGIRVPQDIAVATFDGITAADYVWPRLTTVVQPLAEIAQTAIDILLDPAHAPGLREIPMQLRVRESCGCPPAAS